MSSRKLLRGIVRAQAARRGVKPSKAVHGWRRVLGVYPSFMGKARQRKGSNQPILVYPVPRRFIDADHI